MNSYLQEEDFGLSDEKHQYFEGQENKIANACEIQASAVMGLPALPCNIFNKYSI